MKNKKLEPKTKIIIYDENKIDQKILNKLLNILEIEKILGRLGYNKFSLGGVITIGKYPLPSSIRVEIRYKKIVGIDSTNKVLVNFFRECYINENDKIQWFFSSNNINTKIPVEAGENNRLEESYQFWKNKTKSEDICTFFEFS